MSVVKISAILSILQEDSYFSNNWVQFADFLSIPSTFTRSLRRQLNIGAISEYEVLKEIFCIWIDQNGNKSNLNSLLEVLKDLQLIYIKGETSRYN